MITKHTQYIYGNEPTDVVETELQRFLGDARDMAARNHKADKPHKWALELTAKIVHTDGVNDPNLHEEVSTSE